MGTVSFSATAVRSIRGALPPGFLHAFRALLLGTCLLSGCATVPIGVNRITPVQSYRQSIVNPLGQGEPSRATRVVIQRYNLSEISDKDPVATIKFLHATAKADERRDILFALAELSFLNGERLESSNFWAEVAQAQDYFLLSAVYAYLYLLGDGKEPPPTAWDVRFRQACDLYNRALPRGFPADEDGGLSLGSRERMLPVGGITITPVTDTMNWKIDEFKAFYPADNYEVVGFSVRNRTPGLGVPLVAVTKQSQDAPNGGALPVTAFLRVAGGVKDLGGGKFPVALELYSAYDQAEVTVNNHIVPLETDSTTQLAYRLNDPSIWNIGVRRFFNAGKITEPLLLVQPYEPGRIPVVFVHGTASSPVWWAEMLNTLRADPVIRKRFQFWFFQYNSSQMITTSAAELRDNLTDMVAKLDPTGKDPAMKQMVIIGHSQGGLLTRMAVVSPEDRLWRALSDTKVDALSVDDEFKELIRRNLFFEPLPFVKRVVFISTPHRGSFLTKNWVRNLVGTLVSIPLDIVTLNPKLITEFYRQVKLPGSLGTKIPTSIDGMSPESPVLKTLVTLSTVPEVKAHSIVAVLPEMDIATGNDGVVEYQSAHIEGVESELVVRSGHSCQGHPFAIEEVRRILLEHLVSPASPRKTAM